VLSCLSFDWTVSKLKSFKYCKCVLFIFQCIFRGASRLSNKLPSCNDWIPFQFPFVSIILWVCKASVYVTAGHSFQISSLSVKTLFQSSLRPFFLSFFLSFFLFLFLSSVCKATVFVSASHGFQTSSHPVNTSFLPLFFPYFILSLSLCEASEFVTSSPIFTTSIMSLPLEWCPVRGSTWIGYFS